MLWWIKSYHYLNIFRVCCPSLHTLLFMVDDIDSAVWNRAIITPCSAVVHFMEHKKWESKFLILLCWRGHRRPVMIRWPRWRRWKWNKSHMRSFCLVQSRGSPWRSLMVPLEWKMSLEHKMSLMHYFHNAVDTGIQANSYTMQPKAAPNNNQNQEHHVMQLFVLFAELCLPTHCLALLP